MRVLHILDHSIPLHSGYTFRTAALLREQRQRGWQTFQLTSPKQGVTTALEETVDGLHFFRTAVPPPDWRGRLPGGDSLAQMRATECRLHEVVRSVRPQILHAHSPVLNATPALRVGRALGLPVVYEVRAFWEDAAVDHGSTTEGSVRYRLTRALETRALKQVDHVFTICEGLRVDIVARGIEPDRVTVIPNAVDVERFRWNRPRDEALATRWGVQDSVVIGFIGSFYAYEGLDLLLDALPELLQRQPRVKLLLVGGGPQEAALEAQAERLGLRERIVFTGRVPHAEVDRYYDLIDVLAYPRRPMRLTELVTPLKPLEAMAQGRIFVASDVGGHRELVRDGDTGTLFQAGSASALVAALDGLIRERERWSELRANGRRFVENERTWTHSVGGYLGPYERLLSQ